MKAFKVYAIAGLLFGGFALATLSSIVMIDSGPGHNTEMVKYAPVADIDHAVIRVETPMKFVTPARPVDITLLAYSVAPSPMANSPPGRRVNPNARIRDVSRFTPV